MRTILSFFSCPKRNGAWLAVFLVGFGCMMLLWGPQSIIYPDGMEYADIARGVARGDGFLDRSVWSYQLSYSPEVPSPSVRRAPLFPLWLTLGMKIAGPTDAVAIAMSGLAYLLSAGLIYCLLLKLIPHGSYRALAALSGAVFFIFDAEPLQFGFSGLSEPLFSMILLILALMIVGKDHPGRWLLVGLVIGVGQCVRLNGFMLFIPTFVAAWLLDREKAFRAALLILLGAAPGLILLAWRNWSFLGITSFVGINSDIMYNELAGLSEHGIERRLYLPPESPPSLGWLLGNHLGAFIEKYFRGLEKNLGGMLQATSPLFWGAAMLLSLTRWKSMRRELKAFSAFTILAASVWVALFSTGEFEGSRFYVPLAPLVIALSIAALFSSGANGEDASRPDSSSAASPLGMNGWILIPVCIALLYPGIFRLTQLIGADDNAQFREGFTRIVEKTIPEGEVIVSDAAWAVAWYGDRAAAWAPRSLGELEGVRSTSGARWLIVTPAVLSIPDLDETWHRLWYSGAGLSAEWRPVDVEELAGSLLIFHYEPSS